MLNDILAWQLYGGNGWRIVSVDYDLVAGEIVVKVAPTRKSAVCSCCGETKRRFHDFKSRDRSWRHLDGWGVRTVIVAPLRRVKCRH